MKRLSLALFSALGLLLAAASVHADLPDPTRFSIRLELGDLDQAKRWLDEGLDPNFEGAPIGTGLMIGAREGNLALMQLFLERGADIHRTNRFGETALMLAAWKNRREAAQWLLERGARPDMPAREWTALHYAAFAGHGGLVETLLAAGANVDARSTNGSTVVMMAAREGHAEIAQRLLAAGANPALKNDFGDDAVAWAMRQGNYAIARAFTGSERFAELARQAAAAPLPPPQRSLPAPDVVEEHLRMARLAEAEGRRDEALVAWKKALAELKAREAPKKVGADGTAKSQRPAPRSIVIRAKRDAPEQQTLAIDYAGNDRSAETQIDRLLEQARTAASAGRHQEALRLFQEAGKRIRAGTAR